MGSCFSLHGGGNRHHHMNPDTNLVLVLAWEEALTRDLEDLVEDIIIIINIMVVVDLVWEWVVAMGIMEVWVDLGLVDTMVDTMEDTMEDIMGEEGLVDITVVEDIMEGVGDLLLLHGVMVCVFGYEYLRLC
ncbi:hypothetical protein P875_00010171 [Aspergillus parasiticus SU-1]|uniref:Uncharacterized protein n=1 Tax=Aspergillus parasiticus (strain ATCC 56775 / NRRL 5862 / SRRC 143 / SU-1) TaxID=1403190 RepID=A0A0F0ICM7_ASPPU|nr:hypothetical protein P875_00010171 [Aspergillus parasiticus SU-1]